MLKYLATIIMVIGLFAASPAVAVDLGEMRVSLLEGDVQTRTVDAEDWVPAAINIPVTEGDSIWVPDGAKMEIQTQGNAYLRLNENSGMDVVRVDEGAVQVYTSGGQIFVNNQGRKGDVIQVDTPAGSARVHNAAIFRVDVQEDGSTEIWVYRGVVRAEGKAGRRIVRAGKALAIYEDGTTDLYDLEATDAWERWNLARDRSLGEHLYSSNYLPQELDVYAADFDANGRWVSVPDYGYVWTPTVMVSTGWAPYQNGRWVWMRGDYVWISYERWGWAPYHYGRWAFVASVGWCWVPPVRGSVYWGPGYVGWVHTSNAVAWVPLAPGEIYYGYGNYGPHSVNLLNVRIDVNVVRHYRNLNVRNAVVTWDTDRFYRGDGRRGTAPVIRDNPFLAANASIGRPQLRRERSVFMPVIKDVPRSKLPPARLRTAPETRLRELRETRPVVRQPQGSVFTPRATTRSITPPAAPTTKASPFTDGAMREKRQAPTTKASPFTGGTLREKRQAPTTERKLFTPQPYRSQGDAGKEKKVITPRTKTRPAVKESAPPKGEVFRKREEAPKAEVPEVKETFKGKREETREEKPAMKGRDSEFKGGGRKGDDKPAEKGGGDRGRSFR